jgi:hypothetical protein
MIEVLQTFEVDRRDRFIEDEPPACEPDNSIGEEAGLVDSMSTEQQGQTLVPAQPHQEPQDLVSDSRVQAGCRFICQKELGPLRQGPGDRHALALATGELLGWPPCEMAQTDPAETLEGPRPLVGRSDRLMNRSPTHTPKSAMEHVGQD